MPDIAQVRLDNTLALFDAFVAATVARTAAADVRGLERMFAERMRISPSYWSQLKSRERHVGNKLARQFEALAGRPQGWLDEPHPAAEAAVAPATDPAPVRDADERLAVELFLAAYRHDPARVRRRLLEVLDAAWAADGAPPKILQRSTLTKIK